MTGGIGASGAHESRDRPVGNRISRVLAWLGEKLRRPPSPIFVAVGFNLAAPTRRRWADSPFQFEVGTASLGFAAIGFLAEFRSFDLRLGAVIGPGIFTLGAAVGHAVQMITAHNFAPGNAGAIFYTDIVIPVSGFLLLWLQHRYGRSGGAAR